MKGTIAEVNDLFIQSFAGSALKKCRAVKMFNHLGELSHLWQR
ncbi:hypothetical protein KP78_35940 [Jeotgalibacillus soli]|uniref:Uncharacterized protein n=1 Tax=Jeotgalibacillus soli TaxID=889306 RepID=A0A0C2R2Z4_9BACL|nr:hypothetical protein KP78_35940 [Jeotgalibacillus soli]